MPDEDRPTIELPVRAVACGRHGEVFRLKWPAGWLLFSLTLTTAVLETSDVLAKVAGGDAHRLNAAIAEHGPLCALATPAQRLAAYRAALESPEWGDRGICMACRRWKQGERGHYIDRPGQPPIVRLVCLECVAGAGCEDVGVRAS